MFQVRKSVVIVLKKTHSATYVPRGGETIYTSPRKREDLACALAYVNTVSFVIQVVLVSACMLVIIFAVPSSAHEGEDATTEHVSVFVELCK